jgi:hypothetical protein
MTAPPLGIDIAKLKFNVCLILQSGKLKHKVFPNTTLGFEQLREWLSKQGVERVHAGSVAKNNLATISAIWRALLTQDTVADRNFCNTTVPRGSSSCS